MIPGIQSKQYATATLITCNHLLQVDEEVSAEELHRELHTSLTEPSRCKVTTKS